MLSLLKDTKFQTLHLSLDRKPAYKIEEADTEQKCTKIVYDIITHYFKEFEDENSDCSTFFFDDPDQRYEVRVILIELK